MTKEHPKIAVITGDIVGSTAIGVEKLERAMMALADSARMQAAWHGETLRFTRYRGDGWQVALAQPGCALRSALTFRAALRAAGAEFESYMGIAVGDRPKDMPEDLNEAMAPVFAESGRVLDLLKEAASGVRLDLSPAGPCSAAAILADHISQSWTQPQAAAMVHMLNPTRKFRYTELSKRLGKSRQAVTKSLEAAGEKPIELALEALEQGAFANA